MLLNDEAGEITSRKMVSGENTLRSPRSPRRRRKKSKSPRNKKHRFSPRNVIRGGQLSPASGTKRVTPRKAAIPKTPTKKTMIFTAAGQSPTSKKKKKKKH